MRPEKRIEKGEADMSRISIGFVVGMIGYFGAAMNAARADDATGQVSLCKAEEYVVLSAQVQVLNAQQIPSGAQKVVSLCADQPKEPFSSLVYRFGDLGAPDITVMATASDKFRIASQIYSPHDGANIVWFKRGPFNYYVTEFTGQGLGVEVLVFQNGKKIAHLGTGFDNTKIFEGVEMSFDRVKSGIFMLRNPEDQLN